MNLRGEHVVLRPVAQADFARLAEILMDLLAADFER